MKKVNFINSPILRPTDTGERFVIVNDFFVLINNKKVKIPQGTKTDFASIPQLFTCILPKLDRHLMPAILHDHLYYIQKIGNKKLKRKTADKIFLEAMKACKVNWLKRYTMYYAVRVGGGKAWNKYKKKLDNAS